MRRVVVEITGRKEREIAALVQKAAADVMKIYDGAMVIGVDEGEDKAKELQIPDFVFQPRGERMGVRRAR